LAIGEIFLVQLVVTGSESCCCALGVAVRECQMTAQLIHRSGQVDLIMVTC